MINLQRSNHFETNLYLLFMIICLIYSEKSKPKPKVEFFISVELKIVSFNGTPAPFNGTPAPFPVPVTVMAASVYPGDM